MISHVVRCIDVQVGKAMSSNESNAYTIMRALDVDYVLVIFGGVIGYSGDDINKFLWMVRIAEGEHPKDIRVSVTCIIYNYILYKDIRVSVFAVICFLTAVLICCNCFVG